MGQIAITGCGKRPRDLSAQDDIFRNVRDRGLLGAEFVGHLMVDVKGVPGRLPGDRKDMEIAVVEIGQSSLGRHLQMMSLVSIPMDRVIVFFGAHFRKVFEDVYLYSGDIRFPDELSNRG